METLQASALKRNSRPKVPNEKVAASVTSGVRAREPENRMAFSV